MPPNAATPRQPPSDQDPDASFRARMREDLGIDPGSIIWDNKPHRFPGKDKKRRNDAGWYVAFPDRTGGVFGDHSQVCPEKGITWQMKRDKPPTAEERAEWARQDAERLERAKGASSGGGDRGARGVGRCGAGDKRASVSKGEAGHPTLQGREGAPPRDSGPDNAGASRGSRRKTFCSYRWASRKPAS